MPGWRRGLSRFASDRASALGLALLLLLVVAAVFAPILAPFPGDVADFHTANRLRPPDAVNWLGTDRMGSLMIGASLPIFARSRQLRMREETAAMRAMAEADLAGMRADTRARVTQVHAELASARRLSALYRSTVLPQAEAAAASALASYRTGAGDFMTVLDNRMTVNRYRAELVTLTATEGRAWAELEMLVGRALLDASTSHAAPGGAR